MPKQTRNHFFHNIRPSTTNRLHRTQQTHLEFMSKLRFSSSAKRRSKIVEMCEVSVALMLLFMPDWCDGWKNIDKQTCDETFVLRRAVPQRWCKIILTTWVYRRWIRLWHESEESMKTFQEHAAQLILLNFNFVFVGVFRFHQPSVRSLKETKKLHEQPSNNQRCNPKKKCATLNQIENKLNFELLWRRVSPFVNMCRCIERPSWTLHSISRER